MSRSHYVQANEAGTITHDITTLTAKELSALYGIEFFEDPDSKSGRVLDPVSKKEFGTLQEWAEDQIQEEEWEDMAHVNSNSRLFDEDYF